jgi:hypothetical protein
MGKTGEIWHLNKSRIFVLSCLGLASIFAWLGYLYQPHAISYNNATNTETWKPESLFASPLVTNITHHQNHYGIVHLEFEVLNENASVKLHGFECSIDMGLWKPCKSPLTLNPDDVQNTIEIRAIDSNGNQEQSPALYIKYLKVGE